MSRYILFIIIPTLLFSNSKILKMYNIHTKEKIEVQYFINGKYIESEIDKISYFLRDYRNSSYKKIDKHIIDTLYEIYKKSGSNKYIDIISGYRSIETNNILRKKSNRVVKNSYHIKGKAIDFRIGDIKLDKLYKIAKDLKRGGVGIYKQKWNRFIHIDSGSIRYW